MCGRARRGQRDYFAYLINDGKERRVALQANLGGMLYPDEAAKS